MGGRNPLHLEPRLGERPRSLLASGQVDLGGGFGVNHLAGNGQWEQYTTELTEAVPDTLGSRPLGALLAEYLYDVYTEPGRALLAQCGLTLAKVLKARDGAGRRTPCPAGGEGRRRGAGGARCADGPGPRPTARQTHR